MNKSINFDAWKDYATKKDFPELFQLVVDLEKDYYKDDVMILADNILEVVDPVVRGHIYWNIFDALDLVKKSYEEKFNLLCLDVRNE